MSQQKTAATDLGEVRRISQHLLLFWDKTAHTQAGI
jgi:hypothetical protein